MPLHQASPTPSSRWANRQGVLLAHICRAQRTLAETELTKLGLHLGQDRALLCLMEGERVGQSDLATHLCVEPPTVTKMLQRMEKAGLVERRQDDQDGRISRVTATPRAGPYSNPFCASGTIWNNGCSPT